MSANAWFVVSMVLCVTGGYIALFAVTTRKGLNAWLMIAFMFGAFLNLLLIVTLTLRSTY